MADKTIFVSLQGVGNSRNLRLRDSDGDNGVGTITTSVNPGNTVQWVVDPTPPQGASSILSVTSVVKKANVPNNSDLIIFNTPPTSGTIVSPSVGPGSTEQYSINYTRLDYSTDTDDPTIRMNS